ncbi:MAG: hypothetical protein ACRDD6_01015 [Tannerellaceae bacterium]
MKSYYLPFLMLDEFAKLPRPEKLLLIGLYHQWINNNCLPVRLDKIDIKMLHQLTTIDDLNLESLHKRRWYRMRQCGLLLSDDSLSFVTNPEDNLAINLSLKKSDKQILLHSKQTINERKPCVKVRKRNTKVRKCDAKERKPYTNSPDKEVENLKKLRQHPNFSSPKRGDDDVSENRTE